MAAWYRVVAVNEDKRPLDGVVIEAIDLTDLTIGGEVTTNTSGEALFTGLVGPHFFKARVRRTSTTVGDRVFSGNIEIQVVGFSNGGACYDAVVDPDGGGTHTTVEAAITDALAASGNNFHILICDDVTMAAVADIGGIDKTIMITGLIPTALWASGNTATPARMAAPVITAATGAHMFTQSTSKSGTNRGLIFSNLGLKGVSTKSVYEVDVGNTEIDFLTFNHCYFDSVTGAMFLLTNGLDGLIGLGQVALTVNTCAGRIDAFWENNSTPPDYFYALNNDLKITKWWTDTNAADVSLVEGGRYDVTNAQTITNHGNNGKWSFKSLYITSGCSGAAFRSAAADTKTKATHFSGIIFEAKATDTDFGDFQGPAANPQNNLYVVDIHGMVNSGVVPTGTFLTIDATDITNVYAADVWAPDWIASGTVYSGPVIAPAIPPVVDHGALTGLADDDHSGYLLLAGRSGQDIADDITISGFLRAGSATDPTNATAGDVTAERLIIGGDTAFGAGGVTSHLVSFFNTMTDTAGGATAMFTANPTIVPASASAAEFRILNFIGLITGDEDFSVMAQAGRFDLRPRGSADFTRTAWPGGMIGLLITPYDLDSSCDDAGTVSAATAIATEAVSRVTGTFSTKAVTIARDIWMRNPATLGGLTVGTWVGLDLEARTFATTNIGIRNAGTTRLVGGVTVGSDADPTSGFELDVVGDIRVTGQLDLDGALNHDGSTAGFYGTTPIVQAVLATGAGATVDNVITALQNLGLVKQS